MNTAAPVEPASNPKVEHNTRAFLKGLNSGEGTALEQLPPKEARDLLVGLQASAPHDLPPADIEHKTVEQDGLSANLTIVRPIGVKEKDRPFLFFHGGGFMLGDFPTHERFVRDLVFDCEFTSIFVNLFREARLIRWFLPIMLSLGCSVSSAQIEPNAAKWKTWVLTSGDQLRLPPPPDEAATRAEIAQLKDLVKQRDAGILERIIWWNAGPPGYRWISIAIPPGQASATLHSRIMALLSVAIYDATVAAWDSKYAYNRPRPTAFDPSLTAALPNPQSPSYPSEHAVVAGAASTVLAYLFPDKADDFKTRAEEAVQVWVQAGAHYPSDVKAGLELGRAVGALVVEWGKQDGSDRTGSLDIPPGMGRWTGINPVAPFAGTRKTWVLSSGNQLRPGPPPDCRSAQGQAELAEVRNYPRTFESNATAFYWQSGRSNWNNVIDQKIFEYRLDINPPRAARVYALAYIAAHDATVACWDAKYTYWAIRPFMLGVTPLFATPNHPSYPAAHGSFSGSISAVLAYLFPHDAVALNALGNEAGESRLWAGIHFRSDIDTGLALGRAVAKLVIERAEKDGSQ